MGRLQKDQKPAKYSVYESLKSKQLRVEEATLLQVQEQFKSQTKRDNVKFPSELGEEHPFPFEQMEGLYKRFGLVQAAVDKYVDFVVGPGSL